MSVSIEPRLLLQAFYSSASAAILLVYLTPALHQRFLAYGARDAAESPAGKEESSTSYEPRIQPTRMDAFLDQLAEIKVPHRWFTHFYIISVLSSIFWAHQIITQGRFYSLLARHSPSSTDPLPSVRAIGCWLLLLLQGLRRLIESLLQPTGSSSMWIGHYIIGIAFYLATNIAIFIEALPAFKAFHALGCGLEYTHVPYYQPPYKVPFQNEFEPDTLDVVLIFALTEAFGEQYVHHRHLASLVKYTVPSLPAFQWIVAPHYTAECAIYLCLTIMSRPKGYYINYTMATALIFVIVNLGISADGTKLWMRNKFGDRSVARKWRMIPFVW